MQIFKKITQYVTLIRLNKPIGILLLLWPTWWALWLAHGGFPALRLWVIFSLGVILMRSAGCILNDMADRHIDPHVKRTQGRPLATGEVSVQEALLLAGCLLLMAFGLVLLCNRLTVYLALIGAGLAVLYPFLKRVTHLPQVGLSVAYSWGVPMAFAATQGTVPLLAWVLFLAAALWTVMYDTLYAMVDREDDIKIGVKSTAILFAQYDKWMIAALQGDVMLMLCFVGFLFHLHLFYWLSLLLAALLFLYQQWLIKDRDPARCFKAFLNNNWVGMVVFLGILLN
ncbi:MAG TPA: 4-hydroxybenzoate octaprenyltransferase [Gammaproteobacteria bacterium]|jgi:4-hydroxybenzoate polyprenyltransferase|nr:4-hydroxybenzoate octaprenyltransferase [Gammaproteobacteria bacterium]